MSRASALRIQDVRKVFRVIGDCRDVGDDTGRWFELALSGACRLVGGVAAAGGEGRWQRPRPLVPVSAFSVGFTESEVARYLAYMHEFGINADPLFQAMKRQTGRCVTRRRRELVSDADWYGSRAFTDYRRHTHTDHQLTSIFQESPHGEMSCVAVCRGTNDRDFSDRERALLRLFHFELGRLIGGPLATALNSAPALSPRLQQTLACLMEGDSEKQVAVRMGISRPTVHQYVTMLYRRFGVQSRAELLVRVLRRSRSA